MDVSNVFLHGNLDEVVYMKLPQGYTGMGSRISADSATAIAVSIIQLRYTLELLHEFGMSLASPLKFPMDSHLKLTPTTGTPFTDPHEYQRMIGKLIYLTVTRPDITFPAHVLSQYMHHPTDAHVAAAKKLLCYLMSNPAQGILLTSASSIAIQAYSDNDWANCPVTRGSTSGFCLLPVDSPVRWKFKKQNVVARSTAEAEYRAMALTTCEITWLTVLLKDMGMSYLPPATLNCDNQATLSIAANPVIHEHT
ncbi:secreted RxLR effector protein 161-like [Apium graveolens]|uniref:secreted RxLR effector protein 161-like n=1 Tax=Apium graveolens TaxID=4045 RepID=UPI003D7AEBEA